MSSSLFTAEKDKHAVGRLMTFAFTETATTREKSLDGYAGHACTKGAHPRSSSFPVYNVL